ncbi:MAG: SAM-dependent chlorinase/fluorinase, partial [Deltaproteobacteria bacterium]|nr:SAM-dependent chlorinase/fluorinase [Deltaproteobacteria bacterium]
LFGKRIGTINGLNFKKPFAMNGKITGQIIYLDKFGNIITNIDQELLKQVFHAKSFEIMIGNNIIKKLVPSYAYAKRNKAVGLIGSSGLLEIAIREKKANIELGAKRGDTIVLV